MSRPALCLFVYFLTAVLLGACKPGVPADVIQPDVMVEILYDYHRAKAIAQIDEVDYERRGYNHTVYMEVVLSKHGVTRADFDSSLVYYYRHSEDFDNLYKRVADRLEKEAKNLGATESELSMYGSFSANGDTANVWRGNLSAVLVPHPPYNRLDFSVESDTTFRKGDTFLFNFMTNYLYQSGAKDAVAYIMAKFENDSIITQVSHVSVSGLTQLRLNSPHDQKIKYIKGFIYLSDNNDQSTTVRIMFLNQLQLIRFHQKDESQKPAVDSLQVDSLHRDSLHHDSVVPSSRSVSGLQSGQVGPPQGASRVQREAAQNINN